MQQSTFTLRDPQSGIELQVAAHGAELQSLRRHGREYLWQGDARWWGRRSPVLFPMVGRVWGDAFRVDGRSYPMGQHGFARDSEFVVAEAPEGTLAFELHSSASTLERFPYPFTLRVTYRIDGDAVTVGWSVRTGGERPMPFQIGAHPAFYLPSHYTGEAPGGVRGYFALNAAGPLHYLSPAERGCMGTARHTLDGTLHMPLTASTFDCDTYAFDDGLLRRIDLLAPDSSPWLSVEFDAPLVALWAPTATRPDCPFVCIEPWYGRADTTGYDGEWADRACMNTVAPGQEWHASYRIILH